MRFCVLSVALVAMGCAPKAAPPKPPPAPVVHVADPAPAMLPRSDRACVAAAVLYGFTDLGAIMETCEIDPALQALVLDEAQAVAMGHAVAEKMKARNAPPRTPTDI